MIGWLSISFTGLHEKAPCNDRIAGLLRANASRNDEGAELLRSCASPNDGVGKHWTASG